MKKTIVIILCLCILGGAAYFAGLFRGQDEFKSSVMELGLGFTAKNFCSCLYVVGQDEAFCRDYASVKQVQPTLTVDPSEKKTKSTLFYFFSREARYSGEEQGCALL